MAQCVMLYDLYKVYLSLLVEYSSCVFLNELMQLLRKSTVV